MNLYIVTTAYQLFNVINLSYSQFDVKTDEILLLDLGHGLTDIVDIKYLQTIYDKVCVIQIPRLARYKIIIKYLCEMFKKSSFGEYISNKYDCIFIPGTEMSSKIIALKSKNIHTRLYYIEDGLASYYSVLDKNAKKMEEMVLKIRFGKTAFETCNGLYVYEPSAVSNNTEKKKIYSLPKIDFLENKKQLNLDKIFIGKKIRFEQKFIFLNAWFQNREMEELQNELTNILIEVVGNNCCIKMHPNNQASFSNLNGVTINSDKGSFEASNYNFNFSTKIFVSIISTASLTPKLIYNQEPVIIYLYKIFQNRFKLWTGIDKILENLLNTYKNRTKVFIPSSMDEYRTIIRKLNADNHFV